MMKETRQQRRARERKMKKKTGMTKAESKAAFVESAVKGGMDRERAQYLADYFSGDLTDGTLYLSEDIIKQTLSELGVHQND
jgi:hypothetical protein